jgi:hypothetical protein
MRFAAAVLLLALPISLSAQVRLSGVVRDSGGMAVPDAGVLLLPGARHARTDTEGRFRFDSVAPGDYKLHFRRLGFLPEELAIAIGGTDRSVAQTMLRRPRLLDTVVVAANGCSRAYFDGFLCRRSTTRGVFLTEAEILEKNPRHLADIFLGMEGFHVEPIVTPYGASRAVRTNQSRCLVTLINGRPSVVDGTLEGATQMTGASSAQYAPTDYTFPQDLIGIEIYPPGYMTPVEYGGRVLQAQGDRRAIAGSPFAGRARRVSQAEERCVLVNYWTTAALRRNRVAKR